MIDRVSVKGEPSFIIEYMIKEPEDIDKLLSMEYLPYPLERSGYDAAVGKMGDRGVTMIGLDHAAYAVQRLTGSETLAYLSIDEHERLHELIQVYADRLLAHTNAILDLGIRNPIFSWVGPELYLPPLMRPADFEEFVHDMDKPIGDAVHNAGGHVWVHSHGKVADFIDSFIDMGVDILNPLEPPKNGDIDMNKIIARYGNRIGWEGNIEIQEILLSPEERLRTLIDECVEAGWKSGRFVLCPSAGYMEYPQPTEHYIRNLMVYLRYGLEAVERCR
jgi:uroporphyrinogen-III decarboxylase